MNKASEMKGIHRDKSISRNSPQTLNRYLVYKQGGILNKMRKKLTVLQGYIIIYFVGTTDQPFGEEKKNAFLPSFPAVNEFQGVRRCKGKQMKP